MQREPSPDRPIPLFALGFVITPERALELAREWVRGPLFAPEAFRKAAIREVRGLYLPAYLYSALVHSRYAAEIGENYTVVETYTTTDSKGRIVTRTRTRTKTEWRSLEGDHAAYVSDRIVTASRGVANEELERIEPFDLRALVRYGPGVISGWVSEEPSLSAEQCLALARQETSAEIGRRLRGFMPGDSHRELRYQSWMSAEDLAAALLPIWVLPIRYAADKPMVRLLVNGQTGALTGKAPLSTPKVVAATLAGLVLLGALFGLILWLSGGAR
ncbi:MAG: hypothetical protein OEY14_15345 [Myxococcales bacterium]|nr:hypothetical protein [Myxococcales bacterium]